MIEIIDLKVLVFSEVLDVFFYSGDEVSGGDDAFFEEFIGAESNLCQVLDHNQEDKVDLVGPLYEVEVGDVIHI